MKRIFRHVVADLKQGKNVDVFLTIFLCLLLAIAGFAGLNNPAILTSGILAVLSLLAFSTLSSRYVVEELKGELQASRSARVLEWHSNLSLSKGVRGRVAEAETIDWIFVHGYTTLIALQDELKNCLQKGCVYNRSPESYSRDFSPNGSW